MLHIQRERDSCETLQDDLNPDQFLRQDAACVTGCWPAQVEADGKQEKVGSFTGRGSFPSSLTGQLGKEKANYKPGRIPEVQVVYKIPARRIVPTS